MVAGRSDAGKSYPPLPIHENRKENSALPAIKVQMEQLNRQLTQLIEHLHRLNQQLPVFQEERQAARPSDKLQITTEKKAEQHKDTTRKHQSTEMIINRLRRQRRFYKYINRLFIVFLVIGVVAALISAIVLWFRGPAMI
jgi:hypothetical protein